MGRTTKVLFFLLLAMLALGLVACSDSEEVTNQEIEAAHVSYAKMLKVVEKACVAKRQHSGDLISLRREYILSARRYVEDRNETYRNGIRDEAAGLPDSEEIGPLEEMSQGICPGTFKVPVANQEE